MSDLNLSRQGHVSVIEINRPPHNFFDLSLIAQIADALQASDDQDEVRATVLAAAGRSFCAGADFSKPAPATPEERWQEAHSLYAEALRLFRVRKPLVAAVQGAAIGGGLGLALAADFRVACPEARFSANFARIGFHPGFGLTVTLPEVVGRNEAARLMMTGARISGEEAHRIGLADRLVDAAGVRDAAVAFATELAESAPLAVVSIRRTLRGDLADLVEAALKVELREQTWLRETADFQEGIRASAERRPAAFINR